MINVDELFHAVDPLPHRERVALLARQARQLKGTPELGSLVAELGSGDSFARGIAVFLASVARQTEALRPFLTDVDGTVRAQAITAWLAGGGVGHEELLRLLADAPYATRHVVYSRLRKPGTRQRTAGLADAIVEQVRARFGDREASRLLPACSAQTVARLLPELSSAASWNATAAAHPEQALTEARRQLEQVPVGQRSAWWARFGGGVFEAVDSHPETVLDLLAEYAPATALPMAGRAYTRLAKACPHRVLDLILDRRRAAWLRWAPLSPSLLRALAALPDEALVDLAVRLREVGRLPELLARLAPSRRSVIFDGAYTGVDRAQMMPADALLEVLPWRRRADEARRMLDLKRTQTTAERVRLTAFLPWAEAKSVLSEATWSPVADERAHAYEHLVRCAARSANPAVVTEMVVLLRRLRNEQDPVRSRAITALAAVPARLVEAAATDTLTTVIGDALAARDASGTTRSAVQRLAVKVLVHHAADPALVQPSLLWLEALFGDDRLPYLGRLELRRGQQVQAFTAVRHWLHEDVRRGKYGLLLGFTAALGRRAYKLDGLQQMLRETIRTGRPSSVVSAAIEHWLADPAHCDVRVEEVLRDDPSTIALPCVWRIVQARRTDLLDVVFGRKAPTGKFVARGRRWVSTQARGVRRWMPRQRERYIELLSRIAADSRAGADDRCRAITAAAMVPDFGWAAVWRWHDSDDVAVAEAALAALSWTDRPADALPLLLEHTGDDRARVAVYALRRAARFVAPSRLGDIVATTLAGPLKVTSRKEIVRIAVDLSVPQVATLVEAEWNRPDAHRDVRAALVGVARQWLEQPYAWRILTKAAESGEYSSTVAIAATDPLQLPGSARARYAALILTACRSSDPKAAECAWTRVPLWAAWMADGLDATVMAGLTDLSSVDQSAHAIAGLVSVLPSGTGYSTVDQALRRLVELDRADTDDDPQRDRPALRRAYALLGAVADAVRADESAFDLDMLAGLARRVATYDPLLVEAVKLLVEVVGEDGLREVCDRLADRPAAAASVADRVRAAAARRDWVGDVAPRVAGQLRDRGDLPGGLMAVALARLGASIGFVEPYRGLVLSLRSHPVADVRDAAYAVRLRDR